MTNIAIAFHVRGVLAALGMALISLPAGAENFTCPAAFPKQSLKFVPTSDGWSANAGDTASLYGADVFDGPPDQMASLIPDASSRNSSTWTLEGSYPQGIWLQCTYAGGALTLTRRLQKVPAACVARYPRLSKGRPESVSFDCK